MIYDEAFTVTETNIKTWKSFDTEGNPLITSPTEEACISATRFYLKGKQEGFTSSGISYEGTVGGKL
jgi:hypothetical protein